MPAVTTTTRPGRAGARAPAHRGQRSRRRHLARRGRPRRQAATCRGVGPGQQDRGRPRLGQQLGDDRGALRGRLSRRVHGLAGPLAQRAVMVDAGEAEVGEGQAPQARHGVVGADAPGTDVVEELAQGGLVHGCPLSCRTWMRLRSPDRRGRRARSASSGRPGPSPKRPCSPRPTTPRPRLSPPRRSPRPSRPSAAVGRRWPSSPSRTPSRAP